MNANKTKNRLSIAFILNLLFTVFEFVGGLLTNSIALLSDSIHDLGDSLSIGLSMILESKSKKKPDKIYTYGYKRYSLLGGLISSVVLLIGSTIIIIKAIPRLIHPEMIDVNTVLWFAVIGIVVNGIAALNASKGKSINEKVISLHLFEDVLGWVALLIASIIMSFSDFYILDAILSIVFTLYILFHVFKNMRQIVYVFLEKAPTEPSISSIKKTLIDGKIILDIHHIHYWSLEGEIPLLTLHAVIKQDTSKEELMKAQEKMHQLLEELKILHATIEIEFENSKCHGKDCEDLETAQSFNHHHH
ncbi:MAG: cation diffusion facilitator family transporter [Firmicutes bacterium]|nr:cation diffusion facilitator family transporter [Bacillota bacterium]